MRNIVFTAFACALLSACGVYRPTPAERVHIVDSPVDTYKCRHLGNVGRPFATAPNFDVPLEAMVERTAALGGNTLYVARRSRDWAYVKGSAHWCRYLGEPPFRAQERGLSVFAGDEGTTVSGDKVAHPRLANTRSESAALPLPPKGESNRAQEAPAAQEVFHGLPVSPGGAPSDGNTAERTSTPAVSSSPGVKVTDGIIISRDGSTKVIQFLGGDLSDGDCHLLTSELMLRSNGTALFAERLYGMKAITYKSRIHYYDQQWNVLFEKAIPPHQITQDYKIYEINHEIRFEALDFEKIEHVKISFKCEKGGVR